MTGQPQALPGRATRARCIAAIRHRTRGNTESASARITLHHIASGCITLHHIACHITRITLHAAARALNAVWGMSCQ